MHKSIQIWRDATASLFEMVQAMRNFPRYHKYTCACSHAEHGEEK
jgi:hypothetical protein